MTIPSDNFTAITTHESGPSAATTLVAAGDSPPLHAKPTTTVAGGADLSY